VKARRSGPYIFEEISVEVDESTPVEKAITAPK